VDMLLNAAEHLPSLLFLQPRNKGKLEEFGMLESAEADPNISLTAPLGYLDCAIGWSGVTTDRRRST